MKPIEPMFLILFLALFCYKGFPQDINIKNRLSLKSIYVPYRTNLFVSTWHGFEKKKVGNYQIGVDYKILKSIDVGSYIGYSVYKSHMYNHFIPYGLNLNIHILPIIFKVDNLKFSFYITGKLGANYHINSIMNYNEFEYGIGGGLSYIPVSRLGIFIEYLWGQYFYEDDKKLFIGLNYKL